MVSPDASAIAATTYEAQKQQRDWSEEAAAHRLGLSHSTVKQHPANARSEVGATTTAQLVWIILAPWLSEPDGPARSE